MLAEDLVLFVFVVKQPLCQSIAIRREGFCSLVLLRVLLDEVAFAGRALFTFSLTSLFSGRPRFAHCSGRGAGIPGWVVMASGCCWWVSLRRRLPFGAGVGATIFVCSWPEYAEVFVRNLEDPCGH